MSCSIPHQYSSDYSTEFCSLPLCHEEMFNHIHAPLLNYDINSPVSVASFPDHQQIHVVNSDRQMSEIETSFRDFSVGEDQFMPNLWPSIITPQNWAIQGNLVKSEESEAKVGRYSVEERKDRILRYLKKRNQRNFNKTIKYACRKTLADKRVRVRGRFAKNNEPEIINTNQISYGQNSTSFCEDSFQMKYEEDYWLQAAMDNLIHFPYLSS